MLTGPSQTGGTMASRDSRAGEVEKMDEVKNPHDVVLGRLGGQKGGKVRARKFSSKRCREIANKILRITPAMASGVSERLWKIEIIVKMAEWSTTSRI